MRRMLDKKELEGLGGGGENGVYMYAVKITGKSSSPGTLIFNVITNHTGLMTNESVGISETINTENDCRNFFRKFATIWPSDSSTKGPYILATGTFGKGSDVKDIHFLTYNRLANIINFYKDEGNENNDSFGAGNTSSILVQRIM